MATGWEPVDRLLGAEVAGRPGGGHGHGDGHGLVGGLAGGRGGLARGTLHEWIGVDDEREDGSIIDGRAAARSAWTPPLGLLVHLAARALLMPDDEETGYVAWVGRRVWPYPPALARVHAILAARSIFVDPSGPAGRGGPCSEDGRWWAIDLALRSPAFTAVVADGSGAKMPQSRRLQLAAAAGSALALLARPPGERRELSAATTRWWVTRVAPPCETSRLGAPPRWRVGLLRCKGAPQCRSQDAHWVLEQDREQGAVRVHAGVVDRSDSAAAAGGEEQGLPRRARSA